MNNREIAGILFNISSLLQAHGGNPYRIRAYRRAARNLLRLRHQVADRARAGQTLGVPFLGKRLTQKITQLAVEGRSDFYDELCGALPSAQQALLHIQGIGPMLAQRITDNLHAEDSDKLLKRAALLGLQRVPGIGPKRASRIMDQLPEQHQALNNVVRVDNVLYVQENLWQRERKQAA